MEHARRYFNEHYNEPISIEEFALSRSMSVSWFLRNFKQVNGCAVFLWTRFAIQNFVYRLVNVNILLSFC